MERLTERANGELRYSKHLDIKDKRGYGYAVLERLAAYEDTGLEPEEIREVQTYAACETALEPIEFSRLHDILEAERGGRLAVLPCKVGDTVYVIGEKRIMRCDIDEAYLDDKKGLEYLVFFDCDNDCAGCPFNSWHQDYSGEYSCDGEYGQSCVAAADIGKTIFLTREEAEAALGGAK